MSLWILLLLVIAVGLPVGALIIGARQSQRRRDGGDAGPAWYGDGGGGRSRDHDTDGGSDGGGDGGGGGD